MTNARKLRLRLRRLRRRFRLDFGFTEDEKNVGRQLEKSVPAEPHLSSHIKSACCNTRNKINFQIINDLPGQWTVRATPAAFALALTLSPAAREHDRPDRVEAARDDSPAWTPALWQSSVGEGRGSLVAGSSAPNTALR